MGRLSLWSVGDVADGWTETSGRVLSVNSQVSKLPASVRYSFFVEINRCQVVLDQVMSICQELP